MIWNVSHDVLNCDRVSVREGGKLSSQRRGMSCGSVRVFLSSAARRNLVEVRNNPNIFYEMVVDVDFFLFFLRTVVLMRMVTMRGSVQQSSALRSSLLTSFIVI